MSNPHDAQGIQTRMIHRDRAENDSAAVSPPIYQTSTFLLGTPEHGADLAAQIAPATFYTRYGSPNTKQVEALLADLEGGEAALALGSGMAAIATAILSNVRAGDHVVAQHTHYTATLSLLAETLPRYGIEVTQVDQRDPSAFEHAMRPNTKIVYTETPTNPTMDLTDLRATAAIAHAAGALAITDNTFASAYNQRPLALGYDLVLHSATKYLNGHADVTAGAIIGARPLVEAVWEYARVHGPVLHPFEAWLLRRGLQTYGLRMAAHNRNALEVARFLESHSAVERVYFPGLASHPQHELAQQQMTGGFGGMLAFELKGGYDAAYRAIRSTKICLLAVSLGGVETLIVHPASMIHTRQSDDQRATAGISPGLIRLSVGVEDAADIIADLEQALG
jgi:cystathionine beta-lyase/cystathionine gamma-synthase